MQSFLAKRRILRETRTSYSRSAAKPFPLVGQSENSDAAAQKNESGEESVDNRTLPDDPASSAMQVDFSGPNDPLNPQNWPFWKKIVTNGMTATVAFTAGFGSSIDSPVIPQAAKQFHVSQEAESLATVLFLVGFGVGAPFAGPLSESFGRNPIYIGTLALFCCWILGSALSPSFGAQLVFRFLAGFFGSTAFTTAGGTLGDVFDHQMRGQIFPWFGAVALFGPMIAPVVGGYVGQSGISWRWADWITLCIAGALLLCMTLFLPETYAPIILEWKAEALRQATGTQRHRGPLALQTSPTFARRLSEALYRPISILLTEPIVTVLTAYLTFVYIVSFSFFTGAPFIFQDSYGFDQGSTYLMFVSVVVGLWICAFASPLFGVLIRRDYEKAVSEGKSHAEPEAMLWWAMIAAPLLPACLFWIAWSDFSSFSYWSPIIACGFFGFSLLCLFLSTYMYLIQTFTRYAASALVAVTLVRYVVAGCMVIVSIPMYKNLGNHHATTILAAIAAAFTPVPYLLYFKGRSIRGASKRVGKSQA